MIYRVRDEQRKAIERLIEALKKLAPHEVSEEHGKEKERLSGESSPYTGGKTFTGLRR